MAKLQPVNSTPPISRIIEGMIVVIMFSQPAWKMSPRLMKQKRPRSPLRHRATPIGAGMGYGHQVASLGRRVMR